MSIFSSLGEAIGRRAAKQAVDGYLASDAFTQTVMRVVEDELRKPQYAWFRFVKAIQRELQRVDPQLTAKRSFHIARDIYNEHLRSERIVFGDDRYAWDDGGARDLAHAYEIDHWEARP